MLVAILLVLVGLGLLILGGDVLVKGAASIARKMGISPLVVGLTIVAFGTSAPELVVNLLSAFKGSSALAIGNVVGSNIANILLILGIGAMITPLVVKRSTVWKEIPFALLAAGLLFVMANDALIDGFGFNVLSRSDGLALLGIFAIFMFYVFGIAKADPVDQEPIKHYTNLLAGLMVLFGMGLLFFGGKLLVDNAVILARLAGLSEGLIGLTVVAIGTSLPELVTSVMAALRKQSDIAIGNVVGSNIFNVFWILGVTSLILPLEFDPAANFDLMMVVIATLVLFFAMFVGRRHVLERWQGVLMFAGYLGYIAYLVMRG